MLRVYLHTGSLAQRSPSNQLAVLDIAYARQGAFSDYLVAMSLSGTGEVPPDRLEKYPRWSASLWDLTARALTRILYREDQAPPLATPDRRCASASRLCASIERATLTDKGMQLGTAEIAQVPGQRGAYTVQLTEDILGPRSAGFSYGLKSLNPADLLLRALCFTLFNQDRLGPRPRLILPATLRLEGVDCFDVASLGEPARTGFLRFKEVLLEPMAKADDYATFLTRG